MDLSLSLMSYSIKRRRAHHHEELLNEWKKIGIYTRSHTFFFHSPRIQLDGAIFLCAIPLKCMFAFPPLIALSTN